MTSYSLHLSSSPTSAAASSPIVSTSLQTDSHPLHFSKLDLMEMTVQRDKWLAYEQPLDGLDIKTAADALREGQRGAYSRLQWIWEQLEPRNTHLATCIERRFSALKKIPWDIRPKDGLSDIEASLADGQVRTLTDFANSIENLGEAIEALAQATFRHYRHIQLLDTGNSLRLEPTDSWNWCRKGIKGEWRWNPKATYGVTEGEDLPPGVTMDNIITRVCARPIDMSAMMLVLDIRNAKAQWMVYNGRYGTPPLYIVMPEGINPGTKDAYIQFAKSCISNAAGVLPPGSDVKTVTPGTSTPDTFSRIIDMSQAEIVLRCTGGLMTMLTAPGAGTSTDTGNAHQDAFDDLADAEAEEIAALLQDRLFAPVLAQYHPGQPVYAEFVIRRPDSADTLESVQSIAALAAAGYRTSDQQVAELTGLDVQTSLPASPSVGGMPPFAAALNSARIRYAPTILWQPAREEFTRSINTRIAAHTAAVAEARRILPDLRIDPERLERRRKAFEGALDAALAPYAPIDPQTPQTPHARPVHGGARGIPAAPEETAEPKNPENQP